MLRIFQEVIDCETNDSSAGKNPRQTISKDRFHRVPFHLIIQVRSKQVDLHFLVFVRSFGLHFLAFHFPFLLPMNLTTFERGQVRDVVETRLI